MRPLRTSRCATVAPRIPSRLDGSKKGAERPIPGPSAAFLVDHRSQSGMRVRQGVSLRNPWERHVPTPPWCCATGSPCCRMGVGSCGDGVPLAGSLRVPYVLRGCDLLAGLRLAPPASASVFAVAGVTPRCPGRCSSVVVPGVIGPCPAPSRLAAGGFSWYTWGCYHLNTDRTPACALRQGSGGTFA